MGFKGENSSTSNGSGETSGNAFGPGANNIVPNRPRIVSPDRVAGAIPQRTSRAHIPPAELVDPVMIPHTLVRLPMMPPEAVAHMYEHIQSGPEGALKKKGKGRPSARATEAEYPNGGIDFSFSKDTPAQTTDGPTTMSDLVKGGEDSAIMRNRLVPGSTDADGNPLVGKPVQLSNGEIVLINPLVVFDAERDTTNSSTADVPQQEGQGAIPKSGHAAHPISLHPYALERMSPSDRLLVEMDAQGVPVSQIAQGIGRSPSGARWKLASAKSAYQKAVLEGLRE